MLDYEFIYMFVTIAMITAGIIGFCILIPLAFFRRKIDFIQNKVWIFIVELFLVSVLPCIAVLFFSVSRGIPLVHTSMSFLIFCAVFAAFHVLFEISGYYAYSLETP
jgi:hypothetical protein